MARDLLLEIGVEEIPSAYLPGVIRDLKELAQRRLAEARLEIQHLDVYATPRRIVLHVKELAEVQSDMQVENRGPKKEIAFDHDGQPTKACQGFARGQGVAVEDLQIREIGGIEYVYAVKNLQGQSTEQVLPEILVGLITAIPFPKSMRWGYFHTRFARPIRWVMALFGDQVIPFQIENLASDRITWGHRFLSESPVTVQTPVDYMQALPANYVVLDQEKRRAMIWEQVQEVAAQAGGVPMENPDLLEEVTYLVEYPTAFTGQFSYSYLQVPPEVLTTSMIEHQRYFPVYDQEGKLMPVFVGVRNGTASHLDTVKAGNERVLRARLEDALFFWNEDNKKPLESFNSGLINVLFQERLGSLEHKVQRLGQIALHLCEITGLSNLELVRRAALLSKADLLSNMVYEFPELQGIMGRYYALNSGEDQQVAEAIFEHYLPRYAGDQLPQTDTGVLLSLAEKIHNLVGCFCIGIKPTGSQDPYALRRQALGIVHILLNYQLDVDLQEVLATAYQSFLEVDPDLNEESAVNDLLDFILQRMKGVLSDQRFSYDVIDSVMARPGGRLKEIYQKAEAVQHFKNTPQFEDFMVLYNRSNNLSKKWERTNIENDALEDNSEQELYRQYQAIADKCSAYIGSSNYQALLEDLAGLRPYLDNFFAAVMVMVENQRLQENRLSLLRAIAELCHQVADFSKIVQ